MNLASVVLCVLAAVLAATIIVFVECGFAQNSTIRVAVKTPERKLGHFMQRQMALAKLRRDNNLIRRMRRIHNLPRAGYARNH